MVSFFHIAPPVFKPGSLLSVIVRILFYKWKLFLRHISSLVVLSGAREPYF